MNPYPSLKGPIMTKNSIFDNLFGDSANDILTETKRDAALHTIKCAATFTAIGLITGVAIGAIFVVDVATNDNPPRLN